MTASVRFLALSCILLPALFSCSHSQRTTASVDRASPVVEESQKALAVRVRIQARLEALNQRFEQLFESVADVQKHLNRPEVRVDSSEAGRTKRQVLGQELKLLSALEDEAAAQAERGIL